VRLAVGDTGCGMDADTLARAIEPFFSTKGVGQGTGLGLSMVHGLASQMGGTLQIRSEPGDGTEVALWLPVSAAAPRPTIATSAGQAEPGGAKVLLVDDDALARISTADMLRDIGYDVHEAQSAEDALLLLEEDRFDILITDHLMPGMSGIELGRAVRARWSGTRVVIASGFAEAELEANLPRITKPFRRRELEEVLSSIW
ncbi:MAG TPA: response regulator, partial [Shinella sp.]|nr:response regulator [Shinella sp.]